MATRLILRDRTCPVCGLETIDTWIADGDLCLSCTVDGWKRDEPCTSTDIEHDCATDIDLTELQF